MPFGHDMVHSLATVVDLVNTSPATGGPDCLTDLRQLGAFVERREVSGIGELTTTDRKSVV